MAELFRRKVATLFKRLDFDGNGTIDKDDLIKWAQKLISFGNVNEEKAEAIKTRMDAMWTEYFAPADIDNSGSISCDEMVQHIKSVVADESKRDMLRTILPLIFDAIDSDKSGSVTKQEFGDYFKSLNIEDQAIADQVFGSIDVNGDGSITKDEFTQFGRNFFTCDESDPARLFFGPLAD